MVGFGRHSDSFRGAFLSKAIFVSRIVMTAKFSLYRNILEWSEKNWAVKCAREYDLIISFFILFFYFVCSTIKLNYMP